MIAKETNVYWSGEIGESEEKTLGKWGKFIETQFTENRRPKLGFRCTLRFEESRDVVFEGQWQTEVHDKKVDIMSQYIVIGKEGAALQIEHNNFIQRWYNVPSAKPHFINVAKGL